MYGKIFAFAGGSGFLGYSLFDSSRCETSINLRLGSLPAKTGRKTVRTLAVVCNWNPVRTTSCT